VIDTPTVDWLALSPTLALLAASGLTLLGAVIVPRASERAFSVVVSLAGFGASAALSGVVFDRSPDPTAVVVQSMTRDRLGALAAIIIASPSSSSRPGTGGARTSASSTRSWLRRRPGWSSSSPPGT
jgi:hypothetical protein